MPQQDSIDDVLASLRPPTSVAPSPESVDGSAAVGSHPVYKTKRDNRWSLRFIASGEDTLGTVLDKFWEGEDPQTKTAKSKGRPGSLYMLADKATTRGKFIEEYGIDPWAPGGMDRMIQDPVTGRPVKLRDLTLDKAESVHRKRSAHSRAEGYIRVGSEWVYNSPENRQRKLLGDMAVPAYDFERYRRWVSMDAAKSLAPLAQKELESYAYKTQGSVPGIPLRRLRALMTDGAVSTLQDRHWFNRNGKPFMKPWGEIEQTIRAGTGVPQSVIEGRVKKSREKYYSGFRRTMAPHLSRVPYMVRKSLAKKGLVEEWVWMAQTKGGVSFPIRVGSVHHEGMLKNGFVEVKKNTSAAEMAHQIGMPGAKPPRGLDSQTEIRKSRSETGVPSAFPVLDLEREWTERAKKIGLENADVSKAMDWAVDSGILEWAGAMELHMGTESAQIKVLAMHDSFVKSHNERAAFEMLPDDKKKWKGSAFNRQYRPAHALGGYGFGRWHKAEGFDTAQDFSDHIKDKVLPERIKWMEHDIKTGLTKREGGPEGLAEAKRFIAGYKEALSSYDKFLKDADMAPLKRGEESFPNPLSDEGRRFRVKPYARNAYGMLVRQDGTSFLLGAYYNLLSKDGSPITSPFVGLTGGSPSFVSVARTESGAMHASDNKVDDWGTALASGVSSYKHMLRARMEDQWKNTLDKSSGEGLNALQTFLKATDEFSEQALMLPARTAAIGSGFIEGASESLRNSLAAAVSGVRKEDMKHLRRAHPDEVKSWVREVGKHHTNPKWKKWRTNQLFVQAASQDAKLAKDMEDNYKKRSNKSLYDNVTTNLDEMVSGVMMLPEMLLGPSFSQHRLTGKDLGDRYMNSIESGKEMGYAMGSGTMTFFYHLATRGRKMMHEAPVDTLLTLMPALRLAKNSGKFAGRKLGPKATKVVGELYKKALLAELVVESAFGKKAARAVAKGAEKVKGTVEGLGNALRALRESAKQGKSNAQTWVVGMNLLREVNASMLLNKVFRSVETGADLRGIADQLREAKKRVKDPRVYIELVEAFKKAVPEGVLANTELGKLIKNAEQLSDHLKIAYNDPLPGRLSRKRKAALVRRQIELSKRLKGQSVKVLDALYEMVDEGIESKAARTSSKDIKGLMGLSGRRNMGGGVVHHGGVPSWVHFDWFARSNVIRMLREQNHKPEISIMNANPKAAIRELERIKKYIVSGKIKGTEWLFNEVLDLSLPADKLAIKRQAHGAAKGKGTFTKNEFKNLVGRNLNTQAKREKFVRRINGLIKKLDNFEELDAQGRKSLGLNEIKSTVHGALDKEFQSLSMAKKDGTGRKSAYLYADETDAPGIFVPKGTNAALRAVDSAEAIKTLAPIPVKLRGMTVPQLKTKLGKINEGLIKQGLDPIRPPAGMGKNWGAVRDASTMQQALANYAMVTEKLPPDVAQLVTRLYGIKASRWQAMHKALGDKRRGKVTALGKRFNDTLKEHGPLAAYNSLFGRKITSTAIFDDLSKMPEALGLLGDSPAALRALKDIQHRLLVDEIGPKKAISTSMSDLSNALDGIIAKKEGVAVRKWWDTPGHNHGFITDMINGADVVDLPPVFTRNPKVILAQLSEARSGLRESAINNGVSGRKFDILFDNTTQRLHRYTTLKSRFNPRFGLADEAVAYVPAQINSGLHFMDLAQQRQGPLVSWVKQNLTAKNVVSFMNNLTSSVSFQYLRRGKAINPFEYRGVLEARRNMKSLRKETSAKGKTAWDKYVLDNKLTPAEVMMFEDITGVGNFLESGAFEIEMGGARGFGKLSVTQELQAAYKFTDQGFKFEEAIHGYKFLNSKWKMLDSGQDFRIEVGEGVFLNLRKTPNGANVIGQSGRIQRRLTNREVSKRFAEGGSVTADRVFANYANLHKIGALQKHPFPQALGALAPFLTWAYKALWIPGFKRGIAGEIFRPFPTLVTNNKKANASMSKQIMLSAARSHLANQMGRQRLEGLDREEMRTVMSSLPANMRPMMIAEMSDAGFMGTKDLGWMSAFGPTQTVFRLMRWGQWNWGKKGELVGGDKELFEGHWMGKVRNGKATQEDLMFNLEGEEAEKLGYSLDGKLTDKGKGVLKLRKMVSRNMRRGQAYAAFDFASLLQLTGGPLSDIITAINSSSRPSAKPHQTSRKLVQSLMGVLFGGTVARLADVGIGVADRENIFTSRSRERLTERGENALRFAIRRITGIGYKIRDIAKNKSEMLNIMQNNYSYQLLGSPDLPGSISYKLKELKELGQLHTDEGLFLRRKKKRVMTIIHEEMLRFDHNMTFSLNLYEAAKKRRMQGRKRNKTGLQWEKRGMQKKDGNYSYITTKKRTRVEQLYQLENWSKADTSGYDAPIVEQYKLIKTQKKGGAGANK